MADDWIKFRKVLLRDPRVLALSRSCHAARVTVLGALVTLWSLADDYAEENGRLPSYTKSDIDSEVGLPGFCDAMPPDWMRIDQDGTIYLVDYQVHNGSTAKKRAQAARRQRRHRKTGQFVSRSCHAARVTREEKRRVENIIPPNPPQGGQQKNETHPKTRRTTSTVPPAFQQVLAEREEKRQCQASTNNGQSATGQPSD